MKDRKVPWHVKMPLLSEYLQNHESNTSDLRYSILKNAIREEHEIAEIASVVNPKHLSNIITFKPRRMAFHETIISIQTEVKLNDESELIQATNQVYNKHIKDLFKKKDSKSGKSFEDKLYDKVIKEVSDKFDKVFDVFKNNRNEDVDLSYLKAIEEVHSEIGQNLSNNYRDESQISFQDEITKKIVCDKFYNQLMAREVKNIVHTKIMDLLDKEELTFNNSENHNIILEKMSVHPSQDRQTFMMMGAPASGKSTLMAMTLVDARDKYGISYNDMVKINTDSYRHLVSNYDELGENKINYGTLNYDEAYHITKRIYARIKNKISNNEAPHLVIDSSFPTKEKFDLGTSNDGKLHIYGIDINPELGIERSYMRGHDTGRFIMTEQLLQSHQGISQYFHESLTLLKDRNFDYALFDNNTKFPIEFERGRTIDNNGIKELKIDVIDKIKSMVFRGKKNINTKASSVDELYKPESRKILDDHFVILEKAGAKLSFKNDPTSFLKNAGLNLTYSNKDRRSNKSVTRDNSKKKSITNRNYFGR
jgi:hypothetical protein